MKFFTKIVPHPYKITPLLPTSISRHIAYENEALQYLKIYFDFGYYLLLIPFKFDWNRTKGSYLLRTNQLQKICCLLTSLLGGMYYILKIRQKYTSATTGNRNPAMYFELAYYFCDTLYLLIMFAVFGQKGHEIAELFDELQKSNTKFHTNPIGHYKTKFFAKIICFLCLFTLILYLLEVHHESWWSLQTFFAYFEKDASDVFRVFLSPSSTSKSGIGGGGNSGDGPSSIFIFLSIFSNSLERILNAFSDILFVMTVLLFQDLVISFRDNLFSQEIKAVEALEHYRWLRDLTVRINRAMSLIIGSFVVGNLPFYATNVLDTFRDSSNIFMRLRYLFYCTYFFPALFLAAKSSKEVEEIKSWIYKKNNHSQIDPETLNVVLHEINGHTVGLSSFGCLTVSYGLFGSIVSIILTYALLKTQFQGPPQPPVVISFLQNVTYLPEKLIS